MTTTATPTPPPKAKKAREAVGSQPTGYISVNEVYRTKEFCQRLRLGPRTLRQLRREGLRVTRLGENGGGASIITGRDFLDFLAACDRETGP